MYNNELTEISKDSEKSNKTNEKPFFSSGDEIDLKYKINPENLNNNFILFKNDVLEDFKSISDTINDRQNKMETYIKEQFKEFNNKINVITSQIDELSNLLSKDRNFKEKLDILFQFKSKADDSIMVNEIRLSNFEKNYGEDIFRIDNILKDTVIYPGIVGPNCRHKTFHTMLDFILNEIGSLSTYKEKNTLDLVTYKKKLDNIVQNFKFQIESINKNTERLIIDSIASSEEKSKIIFDRHSEKMNDIRMQFYTNLSKIEKLLSDGDKELNEKIEKILKQNEEKLIEYNNHINDFKLLKYDIEEMNDTIKKLKLKNEKKVEGVVQRGKSKKRINQTVRYLSDNDISQKKSINKSSSKNSMMNNYKKIQIKNENIEEGGVDGGLFIKENIETGRVKEVGVV